MNTGNLEKIVARLGLSEHEAQVYLACLGSKSATVLELAKQTEIKRTTIYPILTRLQSKSLIRFDLSKLKRRFIAEDPKVLDHLLRETNQLFTQAQPHLAALFNLRGEGSYIRYHEGLNSIRTVYNEILEDLKPHDFYYSMANVGVWQQIDEAFFKKHIEKRSRMKLDTKLIFEKSETAIERKKFERNFEEQVRFLGANQDTNTDIVITPYKIVIVQLQPLSALVIENQSIVATFKRIFEIVWSTSNPELVE